MTESQKMVEIEDWLLNSISQNGENSNKLVPAKEYNVLKRWHLVSENLSQGLEVKRTFGLTLREEGYTCVEKGSLNIDRRTPNFLKA